MGVREPNEKGMSVSIADTGMDCTNGGVSSLGGTYVLFGRTLPFEGYMDLQFARDKGYHVLWLDRGPGGGPIAVGEPTAEQLAKVGGNASRLVGPMAGGNYVATSDSRFSQAVGFYGAIPLHDRYETPAEYDILSR